MSRPFAEPRVRRDADTLDLSVRLERAPGAWIELNDHNLTRVADGSFAEESVQLRRQTATNPFLEGEDVIQALRGNITRPLNVWITGQDHFELAQTLEVITTAIRQTRFSVVRTIENASETFTCYASDYSVTSDRPLLFAKMAQLKVQLLTDPNVVLLEEL